MNDPFIISSIILSLTFLFLLIFNNFYKKKALKILFFSLSIIYLTVIFFFDYKFIYELLKVFITYIWYPNYLLFVLNVILSIIILIYTLFKEKNYLIKIINYCIFSLNTACYIIFQRLNINLDSYVSLYSDNSITILRISSFSIVIWLVLAIIFRLLKRGKNEK